MSSWRPSKVTPAMRSASAGMSSRRRSLPSSTVRGLSLESCCAHCVAGLDMLGGPPAWVWRACWRRSGVQRPLAQRSLPWWVELNAALTRAGPRQCTGFRHANTMSSVFATYLERRYSVGWNSFNIF